jgi:opacity protein-like surface antigen
MTRKIAFVLTLAALMSASVSQARPDKSWKNWFGHVETGYVLSQGDYSDIVKDDFSISGGATYYPESWPVGIDLTLGWSDQSFTSSVLRAINDQLEPGQGEVTGGGVEIWSFVPSVVWNSRGGGSVGFSASAGAGLYAIEATLTNNGLVYYPPICDPWFWWCTPGGVGPGTIVRARESTTEFGWNVGVGMNFALRNGSEMFVEARYHRIETDRIPTEFIPLSVGFRW